MCYKICKDETPIKMTHTEFHRILICVHLCTNGWPEDDLNMVKTCCHEVL
jgi:hypothetical protein